MDTNTLLSIVTIIAIIAGPILALEMQRRLDEGRDARNRKMWVFKTLMSFRATALSPNFVQALNLIEVEFKSQGDEKKVVDAWSVLLDHFGDLGALNKKVPPATAAEHAAAAEKTATLSTALLMAMGKCLGYDFNEVQIKKGAYYPMGLGNVEEEQHAVRRGVLDVLQGRRRIPVGIFEDRFPPIKVPQVIKVEEAEEDGDEPKRLPG